MVGRLRRPAPDREERQHLHPGLHAEARATHRARNGRDEQRAGEWVQGLNGTFAVTGGTGAYVNVRGHAAKVYDGTDFIFTLHLIP